MADDELQAESLAERGEDLLRRGDAVEARELFEQAANLEVKTLESIPSNRPRTRGIYGMNAASLYYQAGNYAKSEELASTLLAHEHLTEQARVQVEHIAEIARRMLQGGHSLESLSAILEQSGFTVIEEAQLPAREPVLAAPPSGLLPEVRSYLESEFPQGLYAHQANALTMLLEGNDICLSTSTASGKSLVFISAALDLLLRDGNTKVLAIYPARALIQDQIEKWRSALSRFGLGMGYIDGGVPPGQRVDVIEQGRVILMTPDVLHAWLMSHLSDKKIRDFVNALRLVVLDEAHVYEGAFGTNMAYLLRRLEALLGRYQLICSTATIGEPADFFERLTGRTLATLGPEDEASAVPEKTVILVHPPKDAFKARAALVDALARSRGGRFLAFADSRRMVEQLVAAAQRGGRASEDEAENDLDEEDARGDHGDVSASSAPVLPYRSGYEKEDREQIQKALSTGQVAGIVATSAMELGIDIGDVDVVVLLSLPTSVKSFRQRLGRAGRRRHGFCILIDDRGLVSQHGDGLVGYLARPIEPSWLYLENRFIEYANVLCAAVEAAEVGTGQYHQGPFSSLPESFVRQLTNELNPTDEVPRDLYPLKQRAQVGPHLEFPIRTGIEQDFEVRATAMGGALGPRLGNLTFSQVLHEAYPGAIYRYMAKPYRVYRINHRKGQILARRDKSWTTSPMSQTKVFPAFPAGVLNLSRSETGFVSEVELQVSERVLGFTEKRGGAQPITHTYGTTSSYGRQPLNRFFQTSGVCWTFQDPTLVSDRIAEAVCEAFALEFGVQRRDLGVGSFYSKVSPLGSNSCTGSCIYDGTNGSLRLTERLADHFHDVVQVALSSARNLDDVTLIGPLEALEHLSSEMQIEQFELGSVVSGEEDVMTIVAPNQVAMFVNQGGSREVTVLSFRYTPKGPMYDLQDPKYARWTVEAKDIYPIHGETNLLRYNLVTGETEEA